MDINIVDSLWMMLATFLVFFMGLGFATLESGFCRSKNTVNIMSKTFLVFSVSSLSFLLLGWGLMFGGDNPIVGTQKLFILGLSDESLSFYKDTVTPDVPFWGKFFFQLVFCGTAAVIVSGAVAERIKFLSFIIFSFLLTLIVYPVVGHWVWADGGWLSKLGFLDFAGDTVVHSVGGWAALAGVLILGPRIGKYDKNGKSRAIPGHNMSLAAIGVFVLWFGWFGFNPGSVMNFKNPAEVLHVLVNTNTAAIAAVLTATATAWIFIGKPDLGMTMNGGLAGLVGITGSCAFVSIGSALIIGAIAGILVVVAVLFFDKNRVDDPIGATSVHLVCGIFGTLCVGLFAQKGVGVARISSDSNFIPGLFFGGGFKLLGIQILGIVAVGAFVFVSSLLIWFLIKIVMGIRVSAKEEIHGLDIGEHGNFAYPDFSIVAPIMGTDIEDGTADIPPIEISKAASDVVTPEAAIPVVNRARSGAKMTKVTVITNNDKLSLLHTALHKIGITGLTVANVVGHGMQRGHTEYYRGAPVTIRMLPKVQIDIVICKVPLQTVIDTVKKVLYTGNVGDGKIFISDIENVIKVRTGEEGYDALQDNE